MPKPGGWMRAVNNVFGVVMLGVAIWMLGRIVPPAVELLLWALLFIGSAVYLRAFEPIAQDAHWFVYFKKFSGLVLFVYGLFLFFGSFTGATSPIDPLKVLRTHSSGLVQTRNEEIFRPLRDLNELQKVLKESKKPVIVDVTAKWCTSCKELEEFTFSDPRVRAKLKEFAAYKLDVTDNSESDKEFLKSFNLFGPPAILIFKDGKEVRRIIGFKDAQEFLKILEEVR
jgi:thiol:disulfide interchange protein DsbD